MMGLRIKGKLVYKTEEDAMNRYKKVCVAFPGGRHKDFIDASSGAFGEFDIPEEEPQPPVARWINI